MEGLKKTGNVLQGIVEVLFGVLMAGILVATVVIDRNINNKFPNTVVFDNAGYYLAGLILLCGLFHALYLRPKRLKSEGIRRNKRLTARRYYWTLAVLALVVAVLQFIISQWMPLQTEFYRSDFKYTMGCAWELAHGGSLAGYKYFKTCPNNVNITIVLSLVYRLLPWERSVILVSALLTNASVVLASLSLYNITKREGLALAAAAIGEVLIGLTWRSFVVYTDNYGMIFVALMLWLYTTQIKPEVKMPLIILFAVCGAYIKVTNLVVFAAFAGYGLIKWLRSGDYRLNYRRMALYAGCTVLMFGCMFVLQEPIRERCGFVPGNHPKGWQYMFMVGQNNSTLGAVGGDEGKIRNRLIWKYKDAKLVNKAMFDRAVNRIKRRGLLGNMVFYEKKLVVAYNDGNFAIYQVPSMFTKLEHNFWYDFYLLEGRFYQVSAGLFQALWDAILLVLIVHTFFLAWQRLRRRGKDSKAYADGYSRGFDIISLLKIAILGITVYLMLFEGRAKYLFMFLPLYLAAFGLMFHELADRASDALARLRNNQAAAD